MAEVGAERLLRSADQVPLSGQGQLKDSLGQPAIAGWAEVGPGRGAEVSLPDLDVDDGQPRGPSSLWPPARA